MAVGRRIYMFERFGEFDSAAEINKKAAELLAIADTDGVRKLAEENGIDPEEAEDFITGAAATLCTELMAALSKLDVEAADLEIAGILATWVNYIQEMCAEEDGMAGAVRKKGKNLARCMSRLVRFSFENKVQVSDKIVAITDVKHNGKEEKLRGPLFLGFPDKVVAKGIIREYYIGKTGKG